MLIWPAIRVVLACVVMVLSTSASCAGKADQLSPADVSLLSHGEVVVHVSEDNTGKADAVIHAAIDIPSPPSLVFATMLDCSRSVLYVSGLKSCRVLESSADGLREIREHRSQWGALFPETVSVFRADYILNREIKFERVRGDLRYLKGCWNFEPMRRGNATRLVYEARIGVNIAIPSFLIRSTLAQDIKKLLTALRAEAAQ